MLKSFLRSGLSQQPVLKRDIYCSDIAVSYPVATNVFFILSKHMWCLSPFLPLALPVVWKAQGRDKHLCVCGCSVMIYSRSTPLIINASINWKIIILIQNHVFTTKVEITGHCIVKCAFKSILMTRWWGILKHDHTIVYLFSRGCMGGAAHHVP